MTTIKNFEIKEKNTYSLASLVNPMATTSIAQFIQIQTMCYYYDIAIACSESRQQTCDLLTNLNNLAQQNKLPRRYGQKGRAYINKEGIMVFSDVNYKPYPFKTLINDSNNSSLNLEQTKFVNNALLKNHKQKGLNPADKAATLLPNGTTLESITKEMLVIVKHFKVTFNLNKDIRDLYNARQKCYLAINANKESMTRTDKGESYIDADNIIKFRVNCDLVIEVEQHIEVEEQQGDVALAASSSDNTTETLDRKVLYVTSKLSEDKKTRIVHFGTPDDLHYLEFAPRTTAKAYTVEVIKQASCYYGSYLIKIEDRAKTLIDAIKDGVDEFSGKTEVEVFKLYNEEHDFELELLDKTEESYLKFIYNLESQN